MGFWDGNLDENVWARPYNTGPAIVVKDKSEASYWKGYSQEMYRMFKDAIRERNDQIINRDAWRATCKVIQTKYAPHMTKEEVLAIYDQKKKEERAKAQQAEQQNGG